MCNKDYYINIVKRFINDYFPSSVGVMLTGSFDSEYFNDYSDLDVIILSVWHHKLFIESYEYEGRKIQIIAIPLYESHSMLVRDSMNMNGAIVSMLCKGIILYDGKGYMEKLKAKAIAMMNQKKVVSMEQLDQERSKLTTVYEDICGLSDKEDLVFTIVDAMHKALNMYYLQNGSWLYHGKAASRELRARNDEFLKKYIKALNVFFVDGDKTLIEELLRGLLNTAGGELHYYTTKSYKDVVDCDDMVIYISPQKYDKELMLLYEIEGAFHVYLKRRNKELDYVSFVNHKDGVIKSGLYLIIKATKKFLNDEIIPLIHEFHFGNPVSVRSGLIEQWYYPYTINPLSIQSLYSKSVFDYLCSINRNKYRLSCKIEFAIDMLFGFTECNEIRNVIQSQNIWALVFEMFLSSHVNKMLPSNCAEIVSAIKRDKIQNDYKSLPKAIIRHEPTLCKSFDYDMILNSILETFDRDSLRLFSQRTDLLAYCIYKLVDVVLDIIGSNSIDDKLIVSYFFSKKM